MGRPPSETKLQVGWAGGAQGAGAVEFLSRSHLWALNFEEHFWAVGGRREGFGGGLAGQGGSGREC